MKSHAFAQKAVNLREAAMLALKSSKDKRVLELVDRIAAETSGHFDAVISVIEKMITTLKKEEETDLKTKEKCEKDRMDDTREAITLSRTIDELSDKITKLVS